MINFLQMSAKAAVGKRSFFIKNHTIEESRKIAILKINILAKIT